MVGHVLAGAVAGMLITKAADEENLVSHNEDDGAVVVAVNRGVKAIANKSAKAVMFAGKIGVAAMALGLAISAGHWAAGMVTPLIKGALGALSSVPKLFSVV